MTATKWRALALYFAVSAAIPTITLAQGPPLPSQCVAQPVRARPTEAQRRSAREMVSRAQEAAIVDNDSTARDLYRNASQLDPTDASIAYALARAEEATHEPKAAIGDYCRFLSLAPTDAQAADVRGRIATLAQSLPPAPVIVRVPATRPAPPCLRARARH